MRANTAFSAYLPNVIIFRRLPQFLSLEETNIVLQLLPCRSQHDVVVLVHDVSVGAQQEKVVALLDGGKAHARHGDRAGALEALYGRSHGSFQLEDLHDSFIFVERV